MKVLLTTPLYPPKNNSGLGNAVHQQALALAAAGAHVVVATQGEKRGQYVDKQTGIVVEEFALSGADTLLLSIRGDIDSYVSFLLNSKFDTIVMNAWQNWATDLVLRNIDRFGGKKYLYSHCISTNLLSFRQPIRSAIRYMSWRPYWWGLPNKIRKLDGIIFLANRGTDSRFADLKIAQEIGAKIYVVPNSISHAAIDMVTRPTVSSERNQLIAVGSYQWQKGFEFVLQAYAHSAAKNKRPLKLFGQQHTKFSKKLHGLADQLGLDPEFVSFHEGVKGEELMAEYAKSYLFISGSYTECQPLVLLDGMAAGTPFVARSTGCIASMPGGVAVHSVTEASAQIDKLIADQNMWQELSMHGRNAAQTTYHPDQTARLLTDVLQERKTTTT